MRSNCHPHPQSLVRILSKNKTTPPDFLNVVVPDEQVLCGSGGGVLLPSEPRVCEEQAQGRAAALPTQSEYKGEQRVYETRGGGRDKGWMIQEGLTSLTH